MAYTLGAFERARQLYSEAYELEPLPALLFDIAQCHRKLGQWSKAAFFYRRYVAHAPADVDTTRVQQLIDEMDEHKPSLEPQRPRLVRAETFARAPPSPSPSPPPLVVVADE